eukprot:m.15425 g.15425  ORF g.15425 m.15425 type:complete len:83 (-) comp10567_c0_seq1:600-848(-)
MLKQLLWTIASVQSTEWRSHVYCIKLVIVLEASASEARSTQLRLDNKRIRDQTPHPKDGIYVIPSIESTPTNPNGTSCFVLD